MTRSPRRDYCAGSTLPRRSLSLFHARRDRVANPLDTASHSDRTLLTTGLCGSARLADVGGVPNLVPLVTRSKVRASCCGCSKPKKKKREEKLWTSGVFNHTFSPPKVYNFRDIAKSIELPGAFFIGAGAGSSRLAGVNCEVRTHCCRGWRRPRLLCRLDCCPFLALLTLHLPSFPVNTDDAQHQPGHR